MKKTRFLTVISAMTLLTACGGGKNQGGFEEAWSHDEKQHWHASKDGSDETSGTANHTFGDPTVKNGVEVQVCKICEYEKEVDHESEFSVIEVGEEISIHTKKQKEYLSFEGDYSTMAAAAYPDGTTSISDPLTQLIEWEYENHDDDVKYSVSISQTKDMSNAMEIMGTNEQSIEAYNFFVGDNYYRINAYKNNVRVSSGIFKTTVTDGAPRNLYVGTKMTNCRDTGGRETEQGAMVKQGLLYRTCGSGYNMDGIKIDDEGKRILLNELKIKTEINVNDGDNYNFNIQGIKVYDTLCDYANSSNPSKHHFSRNAESVKNVFEILADKDNYPIAYHCRIGTDRTGLLAILINGVIGVSINDIYQDYLFSNFGKIGNKRYIGAQAGEDNIQKYMQEINALPGDSFQEKTYNALLAIGVPAETIEKVKEILLEGEIPTNDNGQIALSVDEMEVSGTDVLTESKANLTERTNPASYASLVGGATVTAEFETKAAGTKQVYAYLGHKENSSSKKINGSISVEVDGSEVTVPATTFADAGMGNCAGRVNYYFVKVAELSNLAAGPPSITITGLANSMNIGGIAIF